MQSTSHVRAKEGFSPADWPGCERARKIFWHTQPCLTCFVTSAMAHLTIGTHLQAGAPVQARQLCRPSVKPLLPLCLAAPSRQTGSKARACCYSCADTSLWLPVRLAMWHPEGGADAGAWVCRGLVGGMQAR